MYGRSLNELQHEILSQLIIYSTLGIILDFTQFVGSNFESFQCRHFFIIFFNFFIYNTETDWRTVYLGQTPISSC